MTKELKERIGDRMAVALDALNDLADLLHETILGRLQEESHSPGAHMKGELFYLVGGLHSILDRVHQEEL